MRTVPTPAALSAAERYVLVIYERDIDMYTLVLRSGDTYDLGDMFEAVRYLQGAFGKEVGQQAFDFAYSFGAAQVLIRQRRVAQADLLAMQTKGGIAGRTLYEMKEIRKALDEVEGSFDMAHGVSR